MFKILIYLLVRTTQSKLVLCPFYYAHVSQLPCELFKEKNLFYATSSTGLVICFLNGFNCKVWMSIQEPGLRVIPRFGGLE